MKWQPIESAQEGMIFLAYGLAKWKEHFYGVAGKNEEGEIYWEHTGISPTHWMPLPNPPAPSQANRQT
jgi:hypothetical protein